MDMFTRKFKLLPSTNRNSLLILACCAFFLTVLGVSTGAASSTEQTTSLRHVQFRVPGAGCISCVRRLEREIRQTKGVMRAQAMKTSPLVMEIYYDSTKLNINTIFDSLKVQGYGVADLVNEPVASLPPVSSIPDTKPDEKLKTLPAAEVPPLEMP